MRKYIYREIQYAKWMFCGILFSWVIIITGIVYVMIVSNTRMPMFETICFLSLLFLSSLGLYERVMELSIDDAHMTIKRMFGLIKKEIMIKDIISCEIKSYENSGEIYDYKKNNVTPYIIYDNRYFVITEIKGKAIKLKTQKGDYLIGTQNPERIIEVLKFLSGSKKE